MCTGDSTIACKSDQECADAGAGTCTASGGGGIQPNACNDSICDPQTLTCQGGPADTYCDGAVHSDGSGYITCISDIDCQVLGAGRCTITQERSCYADPIQVGGSADPFRPMISAIFCVPPTSSAAINVAGGLPGPGTFAYDFTADIRCQSFPNRPYEFPAGANCTVTTTTTSTTLQLCATASVPTCAGDCPGGLACADAGGACACVPVTTTTLPTCLTDAFPTCGGTCPLGLTCNPGPGLCICS